jgi:ATP-dependent helicase HrpA
MEIRANRAQSNSIRDREKAERLIPWIKALAEAYHQLTPGESRWNQWTELRWMIEEFRVSLFAQELGTSIPVSEKRLGKLLKELSRKG